MRFFRILLPSAVVAGLSALLIGCGSSGPATVEGTVTINGAKLNHGTLKLTGSDGTSKTSPITSAGAYQINDAPTGEVTATVEVDKVRLAELQARKRSGPPPESKKFTMPPTEDRPPVEIDAKYAQPANGKKITVSAGSRQTIDITLP